MKVLRRGAPLALCAAVVAAVVGLSASAGRSAGSYSLTAGVLHAFTGPNAFFGSNASISCKAAAGQINAVGGILGHQLKCQNFDTKGDPADAVPVTTRMIASTKHLAMIVGPDGNDIPSVLPLFNQAKVPELNTVGDPRYDNQTSPYFWRLTPSDSTQGPALAYYAAKRGFKNIVEVWTSDTGGTTVIDPFESKFKKMGGKTLLQLTITPDQPSYQTEISKALGLHPQAFVGDMDARTAATFLTQVQQQNGSLLPIVTPGRSQQGDWTSAVTSAIGAKALGGTVVSIAPNLDLTGPAFAAFSKSVSKAGANDFQKVNPYVAATFDGVITFALAMDLAKSTDPQVWVKYVPKVGAPKKGAVKVYTYAQALRAMKHHKSFQYVGASGALIFNKWGTANRPYTASQFDPSNSGWKPVASIPQYQTQP
jgi:branched-chain amino acid transport system substrate-binding protein